MTPLIRPTAVAEMTSLSLRQVQDMAIRGKIPSAAKLGGVWTFDPQAIERWIETKREEVVCRAKPSKVSHRAATSGARLSGDVSSLPDWSIDEAFERLIQRKRKPVSNRGGKKSTAKSSN